MASTTSNVIPKARMLVFRPTQGYWGLEVTAGLVRRLKTGGYMVRVL